MSIVGVYNILNKYKDNGTKLELINDLTEYHINYEYSTNNIYIGLYAEIYNILNKYKDNGSKIELIGDLMLHLIKYEYEINSVYMNPTNELTNHSE